MSGNVSYDNVKNEFISYLLGQNKIQSTTDVKTKDILEKYGEEFKTFLKAKNYEDKFTQNEIKYDKEDTSFLDEMIDDFIEDLNKGDAAFQALDKDSSGTISDIEKTNFFDTVKSLDENEKNITYEDITKAAKGLAENNSEIMKLFNMQGAGAGNNAGGVNAGGGTAGSTTAASATSPHSATPTVPQTQTQTQSQPKTAEELKQAVKNAKANYNSKTTTLNDKNQQVTKAYNELGDAQQVVQEQYDAMTTAQAKARAAEEIYYEKQQAYEKALEEYNANPGDKEKRAALLEAAGTYSATLEVLEGAYADLNTKTTDFQTAAQKQEDCSQELQDGMNELQTATDEYTAASEELVNAQTALIQQQLSGMELTEEDVLAVSKAKDEAIAAISEEVDAKEAEISNTEDSAAVQLGGLFKEIGDAADQTTEPPAESPIEPPAEEITEEIEES